MILVGLVQRAFAVWRCWANDAVAVLPESWRRVLRDNRGEILVDLSQSDIIVSRRVRDNTEEVARFSPNDSDAGRAALAATLRGTDDPRHATVRLPESELLSKSITLPLAASRNLREIVGFEIERQSPLAPDTIYFDAQVTRLDPEMNKMEAGLRIFRRASVDAAVALCRSVGLDAIAVAFAPQPARGEKIFPLDPVASRYLSWRRWSTPALSILACASVVAVLTACEIRNGSGADELQLRVASARMRAHASGEILRRTAEARGRMAFLVDEKRAPPLVRIIGDVTHLLPDGSWLTDFEKAANEIHIRGYSPNASALVEIFEKSPRFAKAHFRAPLVKSDHAGLDQFDLAFNLQGQRP
jgi:general secretion pathway protein L